jgi:hypothetical protein
VRVPATAPVECRRDSIGCRGLLTEGLGVRIPTAERSLQPLSTSLSCGECREDYTHPVKVVPSGTVSSHPSSPPLCGEEQRQLAWLITKRPSVRIRPPLPLRSREDAGPHKPGRDGSIPSAAIAIRSGPAARTRAFEALKRGFESLLRSQAAELALWRGHLPYKQTQESSILSLRTTRAGVAQQAEAAASKPAQ